MRACSGGVAPLGGARAVSAVAGGGAGRGGHPLVAGSGLRRLPRRRADPRCGQRHHLAALGPDMLLLADRNFPSWQLWRGVAATGADLLWRMSASFTPCPCCRFSRTAPIPLAARGVPAVLARAGPAVTGGHRTPRPAPGSSSCKAWSPGPLTREASQVTAHAKWPVLRRTATPKPIAATPPPITATPMRPGR